MLLAAVVNTTTATTSTTSYIDYILQHDLKSEVEYGAIMLYQEERNKDTKFCSRVTSVVDGGTSLLLMKMNFDKARENEISIVMRIETAERIIINFIKAYNNDGTFQLKLEFVLAVVDGLNGQESHDKLRAVANLFSKYIKID